MDAPGGRAPIAAIVYGSGEDVDGLLDRIAGHLSGEGLRLAGMIQRNHPRNDRARCDMVLEDLWSGERVGISDDRGPGARGCRLNVDRLLAFAESARLALAAAPDLLIVNKFGKAEGEGGGARDLMIEALERGVPVLVAVPWRNIDGWRAFAGGLSVDHAFANLPCDIVEVCRRLGFGSSPSIDAPEPDRATAKNRGTTAIG